MKDTARVLGRMSTTRIEYRGNAQAMVEELAEYAGVPVYNGLTDELHPTQMLADMLTMMEHSDKPLEQIAYAFMGDGRFNMGCSLPGHGRDAGHGCAHRCAQSAVAERGIAGAGQRRSPSRAARA